MRMLNTQLFRGQTALAEYPGRAYQSLFKLDAVTCTPASSRISIADPESIGLSELDAVELVSSITVKGNAVNFSPEAAAALLYGGIERVPAGTFEDEPHDAYIDGIIKTAGIPLTITALTSADGLTTYTPGIDYKVLAGGVRILDGGPLATAINATVLGAGQTRKSLPVLISGTTPTVDIIKPFTQSAGKRWRMLVGTRNVAGNRERRRVEAFYATIKLGGDLQLTQQGEFGTVPVEITLSADPALDEMDGEAAIWQFEVERTDVA